MTSLDNPAMSIDGGSDTPATVTDDAFLGDRLYILQPSSGYRAGIDAVLLAASCHRWTCRAHDPGLWLGRRHSRPLRRRALP